MFSRKTNLPPAKRDPWCWPPPDNAVAPCGSLSTPVAQILSTFVNPPYTLLDRSCDLPKCYQHTCKLPFWSLLILNPKPLPCWALKCLIFPILELLRPLLPLQKTEKYERSWWTSGSWVKHLGAMQKTWWRQEFDPAEKIPRRRNGNLTPVFLPGKTRDRGACDSIGVTKSQTRPKELSTPLD